jgi:hypothetical protein
VSYAALQQSIILRRTIQPAAFQHDAAGRCARNPAEGRPGQAIWGHLPTFGGICGVRPLWWDTAEAPLEDVMAQPPTFEIPQQLRDLTERNLEHARTAYGQFMDAMTQAMGLWANAAPANAVTSGFKVVQDRAVKFAKQNAEACFNLASELANAKDLTDVMSIQTRHAQTLMQTYALQAQELSRLMMEAAQSMQQK